MINPYRTLNNHLPERTSPGRDALPADPKRLRVWVEGLPRANHQAFLQELTRALDDFRARRLEGFARLEVLEVLRPMLLEAVALLSTRLHGSSFPLAGTKAANALQLLAMQRELALGYRMAVAEACAPAGKTPFLRGGQVAQALVRAVYHHVRWMATSYFLYRTPEPGAWTQLYALAAFATAQGLDSKPIEDAAERRSLTVSLLQNQAVLLSLANPYRFSQRELADLWTLTRDAAALAELTPQRFAAAGALALIDTDLPPMYVSRAPEPDEGDVMWIDLRKLDAAIRTALSHAGNAHEATVRLSRDYNLPLSTSLLERALDGWSQDASRGFPRLNGGYELDSVVGLSALHHQLAGQQDFDSFMRDVRGITTIAAERASWAQGTTDSGHAASVKAQVQDQSLSGYRLRWEAAQGVRARIGELVGVALPSDGTERDWAVGMVRWLRYDESGAIEAGVDLIARRAQAAGLRGLDASGAAPAPVRALGLTSLNNQADESSGTQQEVFLVNALTGLETPQVEVARIGDRWEFVDGSGARVYNCAPLHVVSRAGDYLLLGTTRR
ncbi:hypothetical protein OS187_00385 [Xanthomonadaceae bacterium JHOS43]|nr:hypothetical protein [Xanthomonadaceae bacterium JHOS43]